MSPKKFPKPIHPMTLTVGHKEFKIIQESLEKEDLYGYTEISKGIISVDPNQSLEDYKATLLHEIFHVGYDLFGLGDDEEIPTISNEFLVTVSSNMVVLLASLNPDLFEYLMDNNG